jgi:hypothetical protein
VSFKDALIHTSPRGKSKNGMSFKVFRESIASFPYESPKRYFFGSLPTMHQLAKKYQQGSEKKMFQVVESLTHAVTSLQGHLTDAAGSRIRDSLSASFFFAFCTSSGSLLFFFASSLRRLPACFS